MEKADLGGTIIEYEARGAGEPVILIHGSVLADTMKLLMDEDALFSRYRLIRYHRRGYLGTTHSPPPVSIVDQAVDCLDLIRHLGISHAHLFPVTQAKQVAEGLTDFLAGHHPIM